MIAVAPFLMICITLVILPEPNLSVIASLIALFGGTITLSLWGAIALQREQLEIWT